LARHLRPERRMMLEPPVAERPVALPLTLRGRAMSTVDEYHKYARDCLRWAARAQTEEQRKQFLDLAHDWTQAATPIEDGPVPSEPDTHSPPASRVEIKPLAPPPNSRSKAPS
jgi:hypothetical protein